MSGLRQNTMCICIWIHSGYWPKEDILSRYCGSAYHTRGDEKSRYDVQQTKVNSTKLHLNPHRRIIIQPSVYFCGEWHDQSLYPHGPEKSQKWKVGSVSVESGGIRQNSSCLCRNNNLSQILQMRDNVYTAFLSPAYMSQTRLSRQLGALVHHRSQLVIQSAMRTAVQVGIAALAIGMQRHEAKSDDLPSSSERDNKVGHSGYCGLE